MEGCQNLERMQNPSTKEVKIKPNKLELKKGSFQNQEADNTGFVPRG
jgi:hypothetical protein